MASQQEDDEMHKDPDNWKLGIFYYCPQDSRWFVPKKISLFGITPNFANPKSYLFILSMIFIAFFVQNVL